MTAIPGADSKPSYGEIIKLWHKQPHVYKIFDGHFLINFVTSTNQIEEIPVDYNTTRELFECEQLEGYSGDLRSVFSVMNNKRVATYINNALQKRTMISPSMILYTHKLLMFASIDTHRYTVHGERAGKYKQSNYCVGKYSVGSDPKAVPYDVEELCDLCRKLWNQDAVKVASVFQCHFEYIHPFADGNGRTGRWLTNYILVALGHPPLLFVRSDRKEYFAALEQFDVNKDYTPMFEYLCHETCRSWPAIRTLLQDK